MLRLFHAWEYPAIALVALAFWYHPLLLAAILGHLSHLILDQIFNSVRPLAYFISYRVLKRFNRHILSPRIFERHADILRYPAPWWGRLEPTLWKIVIRRRLRREQVSDIADN